MLSQISAKQIILKSFASLLGSIMGKRDSHQNQHSKKSSQDIKDIVKYHKMKDLLTSFDSASDHDNSSIKELTDKNSHRELPKPLARVYAKPSYQNIHAKRVCC